MQHIHSERNINKMYDMFVKFRFNMCEQVSMYFLDMARFVAEEEKGVGGGLIHAGP